MAAPTHYDARTPIDVQYSKIDEKSDLQLMMKNAGMFDEWKGHQEEEENDISFCTRFLKIQRYVMPVFTWTIMKYKNWLQ